MLQPTAPDRAPRDVPTTGVQPDHGFAGPASIAWRINGERLGLLGWGRAVLLQVAHPLVAAGAAQHSQFATDPLARLRRLQHTLDASLSLTFGTTAEAVATARHIDGIHG